MGLACAARIPAMALVHAMALGIAACAHGDRMPAVSGDAVTLITGDDIAMVNNGACQSRKARRQLSPVAARLCGDGWRPLPPEAAGDKALETYRLVLQRASERDVTVRVSQFVDGSANLRVSTFVENEADPSGIKELIQVAELDAPEIRGFLTGVNRSEFWTLERSVPAARWDGDGAPVLVACADGARFVVEGLRGRDHRAIDVLSCTTGRWVIDLGTDMLKLARTKIPGLAVEPPL